MSYIYLIVNNKFPYLKQTVHLYLSQFRNSYSLISTPLVDNNGFTCEHLYCSLIL